MPDQYGKTYFETYQEVQETLKRTSIKSVDAFQQYIFNAAWNNGYNRGHKVGTTDREEVQILYYMYGVYEE